ncbi:hypothetical protein RP726_05990 [Candidatus Methylospira mobilis]|uniref:hypothetical protein n=1 Tax=Candidatus Methylospira mobilis TaxID=1808979 RepID=UPI0028EB5285|nr:hypothetical protein [Candidatus Methylospira mobilis]WNV05964.1 hypothetical protein RP726_05990 [Candidatus Methylospira mobilis]
MDIWEKPREWIVSVYIFFKIKTVHIVIFLAVNVLVGSMGIWMPILASLARHDMYAFEEFSKVLLAGGPYIFDVAYLAGSSSFLVYEYLDGKVGSYRRWKTLLGIVAFLLIILCTQLSALQTPPDGNGGSSYDPNSASSLTAPHLVPPSSPVELVDKKSHRTVSTLSLSENVQVCITIFAIFVGLGLFVADRIGDN